MWVRGIDSSCCQFLRACPERSRTGNRCYYFLPLQRPVLRYALLAPVGWHCFGTYGSNGSNLYLSPQPIDATIVFSDNWKGFTGPVIQISGEEGGTSGRYGVASMIARVFPTHSAFVRSVIASGLAEANDFPAGPYPKDQLVYKSKEVVEYQTPAQTDGLGTQSRLQKNADPIRGVAILVGNQHEPSLVFLAARLPLEMEPLTSIIIQQVERRQNTE
jgi:hypothetical protein